MRRSPKPPVVVTLSPAKSVVAFAVKIPTITVPRSMAPAEFTAALAGVVKSPTNTSPMLDVRLTIPEASIVPISIVPPSTSTWPIVPREVSSSPTKMLPGALRSMSSRESAVSPEMSPPASTKMRPSVSASRLPNVISWVAISLIASTTLDPVIVPSVVPAIEPFVAVKETALGVVIELYAISSAVTVTLLPATMSPSEELSKIPSLTLAVKAVPTSTAGTPFAGFS